MVCDLVGGCSSVFLGDGNGRAAERGIGGVNGLQDVEIKLFSARHADVETVLLNRIENLLRVGLQHGLRARKGRVVERGAVDGAEDGLLFFRQRARRAGEERRGKKFDVGEIVGLDDLAAQTGAAVGDGPAGLVGVVFKLAVKGDGLDLHFHPVLPDQRPDCCRWRCVHVDGRFAPSHESPCPPG